MVKALKTGELERGEQEHKAAALLEQGLLLYGLSEDLKTAYIVDKEGKLFQRNYDTM